MRRKSVFSLALVAAMALISAPLGQAQDRGYEQYSNSLAPTVGSPEQAVDRMLQMANLKPGETLYDLGCGDGRILIAAAKRYKIRAVGVELSERLARRAAANAKKAGVQDRITIQHGDMRKTDLSHADVVTLYLATAANETLRPVLERSLRVNSRVISYDYPIPGWQPINTADTTGTSGDIHTIYLYQVPESIRK
jgi:protein-L-isoaspartate O-methyltransferase